MLSLHLRLRFDFFEHISSCIIIRRMHEMQPIVTDDRGDCQSVCHAAELGGGACSVLGVILCQMTLAFCYYYFFLPR